MRWEATHQGSNFAGNATFAYNGVTIRGVLDGNISGSPASWNGSVTFNDPAYPNCRAERSPVIATAGLTVSNLRTDARECTSNQFAIRYSNCQAFIGQGTVDEPAHLSLTKQ
ncbi:MAG: hypothetical protein A3F70_17235 [Acidobacteria bacterium RIFCSPLOWO2_12_FULL_67_14]|nr:MAG: hypothetical protein A3H29_08500 [Acidobacteria bacterium RIFCSPLOWO2_02_FULL_67_21]OFW40861.1 MAG: hypothetical protein A3F70_17235 [Acidobacteria bacterium RIFCSPLOWO2_12_FULL_67_14]